MYICACLQFHMDGKQATKGYFEKMDPLGKGHVSFPDFAKVILGPYKVNILVEDLLEISREYWVDPESGEPVTTLSKLDNSFDHHRRDVEQYYEGIRVDYNEFLKQVNRPTIYESSKNIGIGVMNFLNMMMDALTHISTQTRKCLAYYYMTQNEGDLNDITKFIDFYSSCFNSRPLDDVVINIDPEIPTQIFNSTFSSTSEEFYEALSQEAKQKLDELYPTKPVPLTEEEKEAKRKNHF